jgi:hypothetical protein
LIRLRQPADAAAAVDVLADLHYIFGGVRPADAITTYHGETTMTTPCRAEARHAAARSGLCARPGQVEPGSVGGKTTTPHYLGRQSPQPETRDTDHSKYVGGSRLS